MKTSQIPALLLKLPQKCQKVKMQKLNVGFRLSSLKFIIIISEIEIKIITFPCCTNNFTLHRIRMELSPKTKLGTILLRLKNSFRKRRIFMIFSSHLNYEMRVTFHCHEKLLISGGQRQSNPFAVETTFLISWCPLTVTKYGRKTFDCAVMRCQNGQFYCFKVRSW